MGSPSINHGRLNAFRQGLQDLRYTDGQNIIIEYRFGEGNRDQLADLATQLVHLKVNVLVVHGDTVAIAAKNVTSSIPIIMANVSDPVESKLVASLAKPGGNITGLTSMAPDIGRKLLELLKELVPKLSRVAVLADPNVQSYGPQIREIEAASPALGLELYKAELTGPSDLDNTFARMTKANVGAMLSLRQTPLTMLRDRIISLAIKTRLPSAFGEREWAEAGGVIGYGSSIIDQYRHVATFVDKILKGAKPADLPVEQPTKFQMVVNMKTAKTIGIKMPMSILLRADKVIE